MIIVSQDKRISINTDKILSIYNINKKIGVEYPFENAFADLGEYKTEERAKEIYETILDRTANWDNLRYGQPSGICSPRYEMPKE